ncbi:MAG: hypothetical protein A2Z34_01835 [Planctomycetes bacterium RBG_16_59_8]|nr:MAG: hypothetical protein A2Z34_01835 [Planctomycetes bacterium RBG_16_59_8]
MATTTLEEIAGTLAAMLAVEEGEMKTHLRTLVSEIQSLMLSGSGVHLPGIGAIVVAIDDMRKGTTHVNMDVPKRLAERLGQRMEKTNEVLSSFAQIVREDLAGGKRVRLDGVGTFEVAAERPKVMEDILGNKTLKPLSPTMALILDESFASSIAPRKAALLPAEELKEEVLAAKFPTILIVAPEFDFFVGIIEYHFQKGGWRVEKSQSIVDAIMKIDAGKTHAIILDETLKEQQKLCRTVKTRRETNKIPIVMICPENAAPESGNGFVIHTDTRLNQPFDVKQLIKVVEREIIRAFESERRFQQRVVCTLPSDNSQVEGAIELAQKLFETSGLSEEGQIALSAAFREAVGNAIRHGNGHDARKKVEVECVLDDQKISLAIRDEGPGFDHPKFVRTGKTEDAVAAAREVYAHGKRGGLGILLMLKCCDRVDYNQKGNVIILTKLINPQAAHSPAG